MKVSGLAYWLNPGYVNSRDTILNEADIDFYGIGINYSF